MTKEKLFSAKEFMVELIKAMPGYAWSVERTHNNNYLRSIGTISSGFNRTATLFVNRINRDGKVEYSVFADNNYAYKTYIFIDGKEPYKYGHSLKSALRNLQNHHESVARENLSISNSLQNARTPLDTPKFLPAVVSK